MHHPTDRITHITAFVKPVVEHWLEREIAQWVHPSLLPDPYYRCTRPTSGSSYNQIADRPTDRHSDSPTDSLTDGAFVFSSPTHYFLGDFLRKCCGYTLHLRLRCVLFDTHTYVIGFSIMLFTIVDESRYYEANPKH